MTNNRIIPYLAVCASVVLLLCMNACNPKAKAVSGNTVTVKMETQIISSGFIRVRFSTNKEAYYHIGIVPKEEVPDIKSASGAKGFMALMLDRAYAEYLLWRSDLLEQGMPYVAEFATHSLHYGTVDYDFTLLKPDTEYLIFAFPVNAQTNQPDGRLFVDNIATTKKSAYEDDLDFEYRVRGYWDYVYPVSLKGELLNYVPWTGATADSVDLREAGYASPEAYFLELFSSYMLFQESDRVHFGIYIQNNNGEGDGTSFTDFESGHTYYSAIALMDGYLSQKASVIYKFRWAGEDTQFLFNHEDGLKTDW